MSTTTKHAPGTFCWPELATRDADAAKKFYGSLFGWRYDDQDMGADGVYSMILLEDATVGALYKMRAQEAEQGVPPHWTSYVSVENVDEAARKVKSLGGQTMMDPFDVFDAGRMVAVRDPQGAAFCLWQPKNHIGAGLVGEPGSLVWTELMTRDTKAAESFYGSLFGWKPKHLPASDGMSYTVFNLGESDTGVAGMMEITPQMGAMPPSWAPYFAVEDCDAVADKAKAAGGKIFVPPTDIPGTGRFAVLADPQGAHFNLLKPRPM